jgi:ABC-2 type transport system permease protein
MKGRLEAISGTFVWLMMSGLIFGGGAVMGIGAYLLVAYEHEVWLAGLLWLVFLYWQFSPLFAAAVGAQFDFANLLRYPLRFSSFFILSLAYGLFEPGAVGSVFWLICMSVGVGLARPLLFLWALLVILVFAAVNLLLARAVLTWIDRWLAQRRTREILGVLFILAMLSIQLIGPVMERLHRQHIRALPGWIPSLMTVAHVLPPGVAGSGLTRMLDGQVISAAFGLLLLGAYLLLFFWLLRMRLLAQFRGELISETLAARPAKARGLGKPAGSSWPIPLVSSASGAIFEKDVRYAFRSWLMIFNLLAPVILVAFVGFTLRQQPKGISFILKHSDYIFPVALAYTFLIQINWVFNSFAYDGAGIQFLFLAPVRFREVIAGKNLFQGVVAFVDAFAVWAVIAWLFQPPPLAIVAAALTALLFQMLVNFILGNILSICFPRRMEFGSLRRKNQSGITVAVGMVGDAVLIGAAGIVFFLTIATNHVAFATPIFLILAAGAAVAYHMSLKRMDKLALDHRETLTAELCRAE